MKITSKETKTFYDIMIDVDDLSMIIESWHKSMKKHYTPHAFEWLDTDTIDFDKPLDIKHLETLWHLSNGDTLTYIAKYYGFDGWHHAGTYYENHKCHKMTVYNYGNDF